MIELTPDHCRALRAAAHHLKPVVSISQKGLLPTVLSEIDHCLKAHELIKLRLYGIERESREALIGEICATLHCALVQHIGNLLVLWRERPADEDAQNSALVRRRPGARGTPKTKKQAAAMLERRRGK